LAFRNSYLIHVFVKKKLISRGRDCYNILHILQNFIQKYKDYTCVCLKVGTKSGDRKLLGD